MSNAIRVSGEAFAAFGNEISDAFHRAIEKGIAIDEAACIGVAVMADYARLEYGATYLKALADVVTARALEPMPEDISRKSHSRALI